MTNPAVNSQVSTDPRAKPANKSFWCNFQKPQDWSRVTWSMDLNAMAISPITMAADFGEIGHAFRKIFGQPFRAQFGHFPERSDATTELIIQCPN